MIKCCMIDSMVNLMVLANENENKSDLMAA